MRRFLKSRGGRESRPLRSLQPDQIASIPTHHTAQIFPRSIALDRALTSPKGERDASTMDLAPHLGERQVLGAEFPSLWQRAIRALDRSSWACGGGWLPPLLQGRWKPTTAMR